MSDLQKLTMHREDVDALEDAADTLMRRGWSTAPDPRYSSRDYQEHATRLYALALRLRTEAGWAPRLTGGYSVSVSVDSNVRELFRRG